MKILIYSLNFAPELTGIGKYSGEMAKWLAARGHEVRVVTAPPYYPGWRISAGFANWYRREAWNGVRVHRCPLWVPRHAGGVKRLLHLASFAMSSFLPLVRQSFWRPDIVWVVEPALMCAPAALLVARCAGAHSWLHVQDYEIDAAFAMGLLKGKYLKRSLVTFERWLLRRFDTVSTISGRMIALARTKGVSSAKLVSFPNWVEISGLAPLSQPSAYREKLSIPNGVVVALYSGNMGTKQGLETLAEAARVLERRADIVFVFCGDGAGKQELKTACEGLTNVRMLPLQPYEHLSELLGLADIHLLPQKADAADLVLPSKLTGMLASGRPVIATARDGTELAEVVERARCGLLVEPGDVEGLADAVQKLASRPDMRASMGVAARLYAERELDIENILRRFEVLLTTATSDTGKEQASSELEPHA